MENKGIKKMGVKRNTYKAKVRKYATAFNKAFDDLTQFVETHCKGNRKTREAALDTITEIMDRYINLNTEVQTWCYKRGVNHCDFAMEITNNLH